MNCAHSNSPQFKIVLAVSAEKTIYPIRVGGNVEKIKHILYYTFVLVPLFYWCGLSVIVIDNMAIHNCQFACKKLKKNKKEIDKKKFSEMMKRLTKWKHK